MVYGQGYGGNVQCNLEGIKACFDSLKQYDLVPDFKNGKIEFPAYDADVWDIMCE